MTANKHTSPTAPGLNPVALDFSASIGYDWILYPFDIAASIAHARMLGKQGIIPSEDADLIVRGLGDIEDEIEAGDFEWREDLEDIHLNIEIRLREKIGDAGARLHTARSRNDQIATDVRLFVMNACGLAVERIRGLQSALLALAETHTDTLFPGYTHLQRAQPVLFAHHLLAYFEMLDRDAERFAECYGRADEMPLGSGALAGVPYDVDRDFVARELGFTRVSRNSIDAVSDRDFAVDFHAAAAMTMTHLSRLGEEIILWSSEEFRFIRLPDDFATGSSIMPQKRNPDMAELTRGKAGRVVGNLVAALTMLKGLPLSYNRDLQEDKEPLFDTTKTVLAALEVMAEMVPGIAVDSGRVASAASSGYLLATDAADYLVRKGVAFRDAHQAVSALVRYAEEHEKQLNELSIDDYRRFSPDFDDDIILAIDALASVTSRDVPGGTAPARVQQALAEARARLAESEE